MTIGYSLAHSLTYGHSDGWTYRLTSRHQSSCWVVSLGIQICVFYVLHFLIFVNFVHYSCKQETKYKTTSTSAPVLRGKISLAKKGIAFCKSQVCQAATKFKAALTGSGYEECLNIEEDAENGGKDDDDYDDDRSDSTDDYSDDDTPSNYQRTSEDVDVVGEKVAQSNTFSWKFPPEISQSTLDGRNGSSACSVIAVIFAHGVWHERLDLQPLRSLCPLWVKLLIASIRVGNRLYDRCRHSLPHRFLSAAEAASVAEQCVSVSVASALAVRVCDEHAPTTLQHQ